MSLFGPTRREIVDDAARVMEVLESDRDKAIVVARRLEKALLKEQRARAQAEEKAEDERRRRAKAEKTAAALTKKLERADEDRTRWEDERRRSQEEYRRQGDRVVKLTGKIAKMSADGSAYIERLRIDLDATRRRADKAEHDVQTLRAENAKLLDQIIALQERVLESNPAYMEEDEDPMYGEGPEPYDADGYQLPPRRGPSSGPTLPDEESRKLALQQRAAMARLRKTDVSDEARFRILEDGERLQVLSDEERTELARLRVSGRLGSIQER